MATPRIVLNRLCWRTSSPSRSSLDLPRIVADSVATSSRNCWLRMSSTAAAPCSATHAMLRYSGIAGKASINEGGSAVDNSGSNRSLSPSHTSEAFLSVSTSSNVSGPLVSTQNLASSLHHGDAALSAEASRIRNLAPPSFSWSAFPRFDVSANDERSRKTRIRRRLFHGLANFWSPLRSSVANRPSDPWLYEMKASNVSSAITSSSRG